MAAASAPWRAGSRRARGCYRREASRFHRAEASSENSEGAERMMRINRPDIMSGGCGRLRCAENSIVQADFFDRHHWPCSIRALWEDISRRSQGTMGTYFSNYDTGGFFDEMFDSDGNPRAQCRLIMERLRPWIRSSSTRSGSLRTPHSSSRASHSPSMGITAAPSGFFPSTSSRG